MSDPVKLMYRDIRCIEILDVSHSKELKVMKKIFHHKLTYLKKKILNISLLTLLIWGLNNAQSHRFKIYSGLKISHAS